MINPIRYYDCHCKECRRKKLFDSVEINLKEIGATQDQYEQIKESINNILDRSDDGLRKKD